MSTDEKYEGATVGMSASGKFWRWGKNMEIQISSVELCTFADLTPKFLYIV